jgi:hypothetical protein
VGDETGDETMTKPLTATIASGVVASLALWTIAVLLTACYYLPTSGIAFNTPLKWSHVFGLLPLVGWREVQRVVGLSDVAFGVSIVLAVASAGASRTGPPQKWLPLGLLSPLVLLFPFNVLGCLALVWEAISASPHDGEFLAEDWPLIYTYAVWSLFALAVFVWHGRDWRTSATARAR